MPNYGIKQPGVCGIRKSQDSTLTGLLALESFESQIWILNLLISTDSSSVVSYLNKQGGTYFQECVPLSEESLLGRMPGWFRFGRITSQGIQMFKQTPCP